MHNCYPSASHLGLQGCALHHCHHLGRDGQGIRTGPLEAGQIVVIGVEKVFDQGPFLSLISCGLAFV
jgi:hypothetical protein